MTRTDGLSWIEIDKYEGPAGKTSITIRILESNVSGKSRYAKITIFCGDSSISIEVEQLTEGDSPVTPDPSSIKYVSHIDILEIDNSGTGVYGNTVSQTLKYDDRNRIVELLQKCEDRYSSETYLFLIDYTIADEITISMKKIDEENCTLEEECVARLDKNGRVNEATVINGNYFSQEDKYAFSYNKDGCLENVSINNSSIPTTLFYDAEGLFIRMTSEGSLGRLSEVEFPAEDFYPNRIANDKTNYDFSFITMSGPPTIYGAIELLPQYRFTGNISSCIAEKSYYIPQIYSVGREDVQYSEPNVTIHESYTYIDPTDDLSVLSDFATDSDGCITQLNYNMPYAEYICEYDVVVGNEVEHAYGEYKTYRYEIKNKQTTTLREFYNTLTINFSYR